MPRLGTGLKGHACVPQGVREGRENLRLSRLGMWADFGGHGKMEASRGEPSRLGNNWLACLRLFIQQTLVGQKLKLKRAV